MSDYESFRDSAKLLFIGNAAWGTNYIFDSLVAQEYFSRNMALGATITFISGLGAVGLWTSRTPLDTTNEM